MIARADGVCRRLMTVPGVGALTALTFKTAIDDPTRIAKSRDVGPLFGLTPGRYQSGETDIIGKITRVGDVMVRTALFEAATVMLTRSNKSSRLKAWALDLVKRRGTKLSVTRDMSGFCSTRSVDLSGFCRRDRMLPEVRMARIIDAIGLHQAKKLSCVEAAELLGRSERHFRRLRDAYEAHGAEGIVDRRRGRASGRRAVVDEIEWVIEEFRTRYFDFTAKHFHEAIHGRPMADGTPFSRGYTWTKSVLQVRGLVSKAPKRSAHRKKRARRPLPGLLLFQDGSKHAWLPQGPPLDLVVTLDDATSAMLSAVLVEEEGTASSFIGLKQTIAAHGLFSALYTDRGSHYFHTPKAGEPVDKTRLTQVGRALKQLGIEHIPSYCPEGRGRMERLFGTLQSRLPPLMR